MLMIAWSGQADGPELATQAPASPDALDIPNKGHFRYGWCLAVELVKEAFRISVRSRQNPVHRFLP